MCCEQRSKQQNELGELYFSVDNLHISNTSQALALMSIVRVEAEIMAGLQVLLVSLLSKTF